ncbi:hypothetical protein PSN45_004921 [Yamadazyma tenuis]|uniref:RNase III domain-containing protein n=1 Tax=Candida tenuis (strain ATCC 10573 / BCRC 21748 / CBS 615 / JCM 9827 / NBRC 10315 / NRRL Y-1498 / VKM Y-70) TaxID=590646 RepID=G3B248_CANTC|nr:uncharacterized protein CANTEDRAFT_113374 [Yamadazyma tenuis ATCC 10573]XP_006685852.1 uncharacterized protein CANTEDRAFT_113374 [Yamadazyma tenuis ATCC 10573]EGV65045.1 hypothetical protein CANTEDRAFT_113374 [Yamadazyma tenuis ATCC 10573]EGV65046.1 hypothetical protein CANTEDRAFT_113374 [Yamadazyma tenuis ATCC 10573]WEJ97370.1 hypothetical protein PSN45_004921 [Yamadazyma tenuis]
MSLSTTAPIETYMSRSWLRQHLYYLGYDIIRLQSYQKLSRHIGTTTGGFIKSLVSDISTFINTELNESSAGTEAASKLKELMYLHNCDHAIKGEINANISECRLFFMSAGYILLNQTSEKVDEFTDRLISIYMESKESVLTRRVTQNDSLTTRVVELANAYYEDCDVNYDLLYNNKPRSLNLFVTKHISIELPPLPKLHNRKLLVKSLVHKELYRGFVDESHRFYRILMENGIEPREATQIIRNDLSFFDGLGDFYLSQESSNLLYRFKHSAPYKNETFFGKKSYTLLKTILVTNTLFSRLALAYNLHEGLDDPIVNGLFRDTYVPYLNDWKDVDFDTCQEFKTYRYEQEFIADYFEQYVGTLFLEQPKTAQIWINQIYENILFSIREEHRVPSKFLHQYDYHSWAVDVIGRRLK